MEELCARAKLVKDFRIDVDDGRAHAFCLDLQPDDGTDLGPSALELSLMSLAGCYATIFILTAKKMRIIVKDLEVSVKAVKSEEAQTIVEAVLAIRVKTSAPEDRVQRVHKLTVEGCPVGILYDKAGVKMTYKIEAQRE
jgi:uncharacterized OsmC-like protein